MLRVRKKLLSVIMTAAMVTTLFAGMTVGVSATTTITDATQLAAMTSGDYVLGADITIDASSWTPISNFTGTFDGDGKTITWSGTTSSQNNFSIFGTSSGTIQNLSVKGSLVASGLSNVGGIVAYNTGTVSHCNNFGNITGYARVGGIVGENAGTITSCYNIGNVTGTQAGKSGIGGIVGSNGDKNGTTTGTITNVYNLGKIVSGIENNRDSQGSWVGGIAGFQNSLSTITNAYNAGNLSAFNLVKQIVGKEEGHSYNVYRCTSVTGSDTYEQQDTTYPYTYSTPVTASYMKTSAFLTDVKGSTTGIWTQNTNKYPTLSGTSTLGMCIQLISLPTTLSYTAGQYFDDSGMLIQAVEADGSATTITSYSISNPNALTVSDTTITVSGTYNSQAFSFTFAITVGSKPDTVTLGTTGCDFSDLASALNGVASGGTINVYSTTSITGAMDRNDNVIIQRAPDASSTFTGPLFTVAAGSGNTVFLKTMTIKGGNTASLFEVTSGTLCLRGNVKLQNCTTAVYVNGGNLTVNKATFSNCSTNSINVNAGDFILEDFGGTSIGGVIYLASSSYITVKAAIPSGGISVNSAVTSNGTLIAQGTNSYQLSMTDMGRLSVSGHDLDLTNNQIVIYDL